MMNKCKKCGDYNFDDKQCNCKPFEIYYPNYYGEDEKTTYGHSHEDIVEKIAKQINMDDPQFDTDIFEESIIVTDKNGVEKSFNCVATVSIDYSVREVM